MLRSAGASAGGSGLFRESNRKWEKDGTRMCIIFGPDISGIRVLKGCSCGEEDDGAPMCRDSPGGGSGGF